MIRWFVDNSTMRRRRVLVVLLVASVAALVGARSSFAAAKTVPSCNTHVVVSLDTAAAAKTPSGSGTTLGAAQAGQLAASLRTSGGNICTSSASAAVRAKLAAIASLYSTNRSAAHQQLESLLSQIKSGTIHAPLIRTVASARRAASTLCPSVQSTISISGAAKTSADLAAEATATAAGDTAGAGSAAQSAVSDYAAWAASSGASTVGDWIAIAQGAQALGDDSLSASALDSARSAADANLKKATPADPCKATPSEINCFVQANAIAQLLGVEGTPDLAKKLDCGDSWSFAMVLSGQASNGESFGTFTWGPGRFTVDQTANTITDAGSGGSEWKGSAGGSYSCHGDGIPSESGTMAPFGFHYRLTGKIVASRHLWIITAPAGDFSLPNPFHGNQCKGLATFGITVLDAIVKNGLPVEFTVLPGQRTATYTVNTGSGTIKATIQKLSIDG